MKTPPKLQTCPHCTELATTLRGCGNVMGASHEHYLLAAVLGLQRDGATLDGAVRALRVIWEAEDNTPRAASGPVNLQDVSVVDSAPGNAIDAFVASLGERPA